MAPKAIIPAAVKLQVTIPGALKGWVSAEAARRQVSEAQVVRWALERARERQELSQKTAEREVGDAASS